MRKILTSFGIIIFVFLCIALTTFSQPNYEVDFGKVQPGEKVTRTLYLEFNQAGVEADHYFDLQLVDEEGQPIKDIDYLKDGKSVDNNYIRIHTNQFEPEIRQEVKISFIPKKEKQYDGQLKVIRTSQGLRENFLDKDGNPLNMEKFAIDFVMRSHIPWTITEYLLFLVLPGIIVLIIIYFVIQQKKKFTRGSIIIIEPERLSGQYVLKGKQKFKLDELDPSLQTYLVLKKGTNGLPKVKTSKAIFMINDNPASPGKLIEDGYVITVITHSNDTIKFEYRK